MAAPNRITVYLGLILLSMISSAVAEPKYGLGHTVTDAQIASWNIDVAPDGKNLPIGQGTVAAGEKVYQTNCLACHGVNLEGGMGPALVGGRGTLTTEKPVKTVGSYWPYATTLFDYVRRAMPFQQPQSLSNDQVYAVVGYILNKNELMDANATVDAQTLINVKMPNRDAFYVDDRPDAKASACYQDCK
ncbi:cytochrome c [Pseudomonas atacamensis]|uniref:Cytochrome c n=1 Tax=Pseudomonas atacamensis TaxID=2565368 RepID=A0AAQ2HYB1_9PSED|nr:cytochrome c [Pseudomonas atacamensis]THF25781.1 cytochrome c [Pseudomonas atacamensis]